MTGPRLQLPWDRPEWLEEASAWIHDQVAAHGRRITGPVEVLHQRPWAAFAQVATDKGVVYFKAPSPANAHEVALTEALARWRPDCTVPLLAVDHERSWLLSADAGVTLRSLGRTPEQVEHWLHILPLLVDLQIEMPARVPELLALGVPDRRLARFPHLYAELLEDTENLRVGLRPGLTPAEYRQLLDLRPRVADLCEHLAGYGLPETLAHEEAHENNVLVHDGRYTFTDWSDCSVAHPFFTIFITLRTLVYWLKLDEDGPQLRRLRDLYLEPWTAFATRQELSTAFELACRLATVNRALSYHDTMGALAEKDRQAYLDSIPGWLQEFLKAESSAHAPGA